MDVFNSACYGSSTKKIRIYRKRIIEVLSSTAIRFRIINWIDILVLLVTGLLNAVNWGVKMDMISTGDFFSSYFGKILTVKKILVFAMSILSAIHDLILGHKMIDVMTNSSSNPDSIHRLKNYRRYISWLARANAILGIIIVACAVMLS